MKSQKPTLTVNHYKLFKFEQNIGASSFHTTDPTTITIGTNTGTIIKTGTVFHEDNSHNENYSSLKADR